MEDLFDNLTEILRPICQKAHKVFTVTYIETIEDNEVDEDEFESMKIKKISNETKL